MTTRKKPKRRVGRIPQPPWRLANSMLAGLPMTRAEWLAIVLPAIDATTTHPRCATYLATQGYAIHGDRPGESVRRWYVWLVAERRAGRLPERREPLPPREAGGQAGDQPPSAHGIGALIVEHLREHPRANCGDIATAVYGSDDEGNRLLAGAQLRHLRTRGVLRRVGVGEYEVAK